MDPAKVEAYYIHLVFPLIGNLYAEALIIGVFVVGFGMLRHSLRNSQLGNRHSLLQRGLLLIVVMVWTANLHASYLLYGRQFDGRPPGLNAAEADVLATMTRSMIPVEILTTIVTALMFAIIAYRDYQNLSTRPGCMRKEITVLFWLAAASHILFLLWFVVVYGTTGRMATLTAMFSPSQPGIGLDSSPADQPVGFNITFHFVIAMIYLVLAIVWRRFSRKNVYEERYRAWDWVAILIFCFVMLNVYWYRMGQYLSNVDTHT